MLTSFFVFSDILYLDDVFERFEKCFVFIKVSRFLTDRHKYHNTICKDFEKENNDRYSSLPIEKKAPIWYNIVVPVGMTKVHT